MAYIPIATIRWNDPNVTKYPNPLYASDIGVLRTAPDNYGHSWTYPPVYISGEGNIYFFAFKYIDPNDSTKLRTQMSLISDQPFTYKRFSNDEFNMDFTSVQQTSGGVTYYVSSISSGVEWGDFSSLPYCASYDSSDHTTPSASDFAPLVINGTATPYTDPYSYGGNAGTGGGSGTFSATGDSVDFPSAPTLSATSAGFITLFNPSAAELRSLASYLWTGAFDINTFRKIFADPMDAILGLSIVPVNVASGGTATVQVGNISTGITMTLAASQYVTVDCGTLNVEEFFGGYLDYDPYTKAEIYLPYIGTRPVAVDDIMGKSVHVEYRVDILSGACNAFIKCDDSVLYNFIGQCSSSIPITGNDWTNVINGVLSAGVSVGSLVATGGMTAPMAIPALASTAVNSMKPAIEKSGALSGTGGMLGIQTPYLILTRPRQALPTNQNSYTGYPSFITSSLSSLSGYTEVEHIHLEGVPATEAELSEIENLLKGGVIL